MGQDNFRENQANSGLHRDLFQKGEGGKAGLANCQKPSKVTMAKTASEKLHTIQAAAPTSQPSRYSQTALQLSAAPLPQGQELCITSASPQMYTSPLSLRMAAWDTSCPLHLGCSKVTNLISFAASLGPFVMGLVGRVGCVRNR